MPVSEYRIGPRPYTRALNPMFTRFPIGVGSCFAYPQLPVTFTCQNGDWQWLTSSEKKLSLSCAVTTEMSPKKRCACGVAVYLTKLYTFWCSRCRLAHGLLSSLSSIREEHDEKSFKLFFKAISSRDSPFYLQWLINLVHTDPAKIHWKITLVQTMFEHNRWIRTVRTTSTERVAISGK